MDRVVCKTNLANEKHVSVIIAQAGMTGRGNAVNGSNMGELDNDPASGSGVSR